jgi:addiction module RelE/StbE family toxin
MSDEFLKSIEKVDQKIRGRILEAMGKISRNPEDMKGNTVMPLAGDYKGFWRYRIGNYRLVYKPENDSHSVTLISFASRGSAYD